MRKISWLFSLLLLVTVINYPNPFNPKGGESATFKVTSDTTVESTIYIYNLSAQLVARIPFSIGNGANYKTWNGYSDANELVATGLYPYQLIAGGQRLGRGKIWVINQ